MLRLQCTQNLPIYGRFTTGLKMRLNENARNESHAKTSFLPNGLLEHVIDLLLESMDYNLYDNDGKGLTVVENQDLKQFRLRIIVVDTVTDNQVPLCYFCTQLVDDIVNDDANFALKCEFDGLKDECVDLRIVIVDTNTGLEVALCSACTHRVDAIVHKVANFALKCEYVELKDEFEYDDCAEESEINTGYKLQQNLSRAESDKADARSLAWQKNYLFPECEYDILEKKLIGLEAEMQSVVREDHLKEMDETYEACVERWVAIFCRDNEKSFYEHRDEALSVLKYNLGLRRDIVARELAKKPPRRPSRRPKRSQSAVDALTSADIEQFASPQNFPQQFFYTTLPESGFGQC